MLNNIPAHNHTVACPHTHTHTALLLHNTDNHCVHVMTLNPCSTVLLDKLTSFKPVKKFPVFYGTRTFLTAVPSARHLTLSWANLSQSIPLTSHFLKFQI